jgi:hypothetical protein
MLRAIPGLIAEIDRLTGAAEDDGSEDEPGYPSKAQLKRIATWPIEDFKGWMAFIKTVWAYADWGWHEQDGLYQISTAGWSGNESIIRAMEKNPLWILGWQQSRRGGHYELRDPWEKK